MERLEWLTYDTFAPHVGSAFGARVGDDTVQLVLADAQEGTHPGGQAPDGAVRSQFRLVFHGPPTTLLEQATYLFSNDSVGEFLLFIVPVAADAQGVLYEAVFS